MNHPIIDCKIQIEEGIEAHLEQIEEDLLNKKSVLIAMLLMGIEKYDKDVLAECAVDVDILEGYVKQMLG